TPVSSSASPGEPTPTPARSRVPSPPCAAASRTAAAISRETSSGPPSVGVGRRDWPSTWLPGSTMTAWILVPPRSIPPRGAWSGSGLTGKTITGCSEPLCKAPRVPSLGQWRTWWIKRRWNERNRRWRRRVQLDRHAAQGGFFIRYPIEGEVLEGLHPGKLEIGEGALAEPGCWRTLAGDARIRIGKGCFLNKNTMLAALELIEIGDHVMFANNCFVGDSDHRYDDPTTPVTWQGFERRGPVRIGSNCWFGVNCVVTGGVQIGERCLIGANSFVTLDLPTPPT